MEPGADCGDTDSRVPDQIESPEQMLGQMQRMTTRTADGFYMDHGMGHTIAEHRRSEQRAILAEWEYDHAKCCLTLSETRVCTVPQTWRRTLPSTKKKTRSVKWSVCRRYVWRM